MASKHLKPIVFTAAALLFASAANPAGAQVVRFPAGAEIIVYPNGDVRMFTPIDRTQAAGCDVATADGTSVRIVEGKCPLYFDGLKPNPTRQELIQWVEAWKQRHPGTVLCGNSSELPVKASMGTIPSSSLHCNRRLAEKATSAQIKAHNSLRMSMIRKRYGLP